MIIGLIGEKLAGKDSVANYLVEKYRADHVRTSHILDDLLSILGLPKTRRNEIDIGKAMETVFGEQVIGRALLNRIRQSTADMVVNNGLRQEYQFQDAKNMGAKIIYVTAPAELRFERSQKADKDEHQDFQAFLKQEQEWIEAEIPRLGRQADFKIENTGTLEGLYGKIDAIVSTLHQ